MKTASPALRHLIESGQYARADLYTLTLVDGTVIRSTNADVDITHKGQLFESEELMISRESIMSGLGLEVDTLELEVTPRSDQMIAGLPFPEAVRFGSLDGATFLLEKAYFSEWPDPTVPVTTNYIKNNTFAGAAVGVIGSGGALPIGWGFAAAAGITKEVVSLGEEDGIEHIALRAYGTPTTTNTILIIPLNNSADRPAASAGEYWTHSSHLKFDGAPVGLTYASIVTYGINSVGSQAGSPTNTVIPRVAGTSGLEDKLLAATEIMETGTLSVLPRLHFSHAANVAIDFTIIIGLPKLERTPHATSGVIRTSTGILTQSTGLVGTLHGFQGLVSDVDGGRTGYNIQVKSALELVNTQMPRNVYQSTCLHTLYDSGCGLLRANFTTTGIVGTGSTVTEVETDHTQATGYFDLGVIVFTSGPLNGLRRTIKRHINEGTGSNFSLILPLPSIPASGTTFQVYPGCTRTQAQCAAKFNNLANFKGYPYIPMPETVY